MTTKTTAVPPHQPPGTMKLPTTIYVTQAIRNPLDATNNLAKGAVFTKEMVNSLGVKRTKQLVKKGLLAGDVTFDEAVAKNEPAVASESSMGATAKSKASTEKSSDSEKDSKDEKEKKGENKEK